MTEKIVCPICKATGRIIDSSGGNWVCPKCSGYGHIEKSEPTKIIKICPTHDVPMKWEGLGSGYWVCPLED